MVVRSRTSLPSAILTLLTLFASSSLAHTVITYPGWRGDNLYTSGRTPDDQIPIGSLGANWNNKTNTYEYPYGQQWMYPCGGIGTTQNRTKWPIDGGAVAFQPGWFAGHQTALIYVNMGLGNEPLNYSHPIVPVFQLTGPTNQMYPGTFCLPQVPLPANISVNIGDNATIQIIETAVHGAALYSCVDITFAADTDPEIPELNSTNCFNSTGGDQGGPLGMNYVYTAQGTTVGSAAPISMPFSWALMSSAALASVLVMTL